MYSGVCKKNRESKRRYEQVTFGTEKPKYRHVLTHGPSWQVPDIHNSSFKLLINSSCSGIRSDHYYMKRIQCNLVGQEYNHCYLPPRHGNAWLYVAGVDSWMMVGEAKVKVAELV